MIKILAIDDEAEVLQQVAVLLKRHGYRIHTAFDGTTGLEAAKRHLPNLILLDIIMPGMDGFELLSRLKVDSATSSIPVVMLTAKGETQSLFKAKDLRADDYLIKPFTVDSLLEVVHRYTL